MKFTGSTSLTAWISFAAVLAVEFTLFHHFVRNEIAWSYPATFDQASFLERSYETYDQMIRLGGVRGLLAGAGFGDGRPLANGALMHLQAAVFFCAFGANRVTALTVNFFYLTLFQGVVFASVRTFTRSWSVPFIALGLMLTARTTFQGTGGIADFRMDFGGFCLFGIFIAFVLRSNLFENRRWSVAAGLAAAYTIAFRFITLAYFIPIFAITLFIAAGASGRSRREQRRREVSNRLRNLFLSAAVAALAAAPVLVHHWAATSSYYYRNHASGSQRYIRAALWRNTTALEQVLFYPRSLVLHHAGFIFCALTAGLWLARLIPASIGKLILSPAQRRETLAARAFVFISLLVPLLILTCDADRSAAVGDILVGPAVWIAVLGAIPSWSVQAGNTLGTRRTVILAALSMIVGLAVQVYSYSQHSKFAVRRPEIASVLNLYDRVFSIAMQNQWSHPAIANNSFVDFLDPKSLDVVTDERHHYLLHADEVLATDLAARTPEEIDEALKRADFVFVSTRTTRRDVESPFLKSMRESQLQIANFCALHLTLEDEFYAMGSNVQVFVKNTK